MSNRDTSGLWDKSQAGTPRDVGVAPPPRRKNQSQSIRQQRDVQAQRVVDVGAAPRALEVVGPPTEETEETLQGSEEGSFADQELVKLALSFTADQMDWLRKNASKRDQWAGEFFEDLFFEHKDAIATRGTKRRSRRRNANYTGTRLSVTAALFDEFVALAKELSTSRAALGRAVMEAARQPVT